MSLKDLKPAYTCDCGESYMFLMPSNCRKCGRPIVKNESWVTFDPAKYARFSERVSEVGIEQATKELLPPE